MGIDIQHVICMLPLLFSIPNILRWALISYFSIGVNLFPFSCSTSTSPSLSFPFVSHLLWMDETLNKLLLQMSELESLLFFLQKPWVMVRPLAINHTEILAHINLYNPLHSDLLKLYNPSIGNLSIKKSRKLGDIHIWSELIGFFLWNTP